MLVLQGPGLLQTRDTMRWSSGAHQVYVPQSPGVPREAGAQGRGQEDGRVRGEVYTWNIAPSGAPSIAPTTPFARARGRWARSCGRTRCVDRHTLHPASKAGRTGKTVFMSGTGGASRSLRSTRTRTSRAKSRSSNKQRSTIATFAIGDFTVLTRLRPTCLPLRRGAPQASSCPCGWCSGRCTARKSPRGPRA